MTKCLVCEKREATKWFNLMFVCPECYNNLERRLRQISADKLKAKERGK